MASAISKYDSEWNVDDPLDIEFEIIRAGGTFRKVKGGPKFGNGLFFHYKAAMQLLWPEDDWHRWADDVLRELLAHKYVGIMGCANSNKTYMSAKWALLDYWVFPNDTLTILSSTDTRGLELRIWGSIKDLFNQGQEYRENMGSDSLPGVVLESIHSITTDEINEHEKGKKARVLKKGIIGIPCMQNGKFVGIGKYCGVKQKRLRLIGDEGQFMGPSYIKAISNLSQQPGFKCAMLGNAIDPLDPLGQFCEPKEGWQSHPEPTVTTVWQTKWPDGVCLNLVGTDSPNFDYPETEPVKYPYMVNRVSIKEVEDFFGKDSIEYWSQCKGVLKSGLLKKRIITPDFCKQHEAHNLAIWDATERTKAASLDAAYGGVGGDRCVFRWGEYGLSYDNKEIVRVERPEIVPVSISRKESPEDQIALWCHKRLLELGIPAERLYYDATGRGSLGAAFARIMGTSVPTPVEFGGRPTTRPVRHDLFIIDEVTSERRLKRCDEHYFDMVSELWFSVRYTIESNQMRELDQETMREGCQREFGMWAAKKYFVESKHKPRQRKLMAVSPDLFDALVVLVEGFRRLGFKIMNLGEGKVKEFTENNWLADAGNQWDKVLKGHMIRRA